MGGREGKATRLQPLPAPPPAASATTPLRPTSRHLGTTAGMGLERKREEDRGGMGGRTGEGRATEDPAPRRSAIHVSMILPQVHLRKPCYDFSFL